VSCSSITVTGPLVAALVPLLVRLFPIYYPSFSLPYCVIAVEGGRVAAWSEHAGEKPASELAWEQRLLTLGRRPRAGVPIPQTTVAGAQGPQRRRVSR
jgi:hypothetical protein